MSSLKIFETLWKHRRGLLALGIMAALALGPLAAYQVSRYSGDHRDEACDCENNAGASGTSTSDGATNDSENHGDEENGEETSPFGLTSEWWLVIFTAALTAFTAVLAGATVWLGLSTKKLWVGAEKQAGDLTKATNAIVRQTKALIAIEQIHWTMCGLYLLEINELGGRTPMPPRQPLPKKVALGLHYRNDGRNSVEIEDIRIGWHVGQLEAEPTYQVTIGYFPGNSVGPGKNLHDISQDARNVIELKSASALAAVNADEEPFWLFVEVNYFDFMRAPQSLRMCTQWIPPTDSNAGNGVFAYNSSCPAAYTKKPEPEEHQE